MALDLEVQSKLRPCYVRVKKDNKEKALFHCWNFVKNVVGPSPMVGGHPAGLVAYVTGIVEFEDGSVDEVSPERIQFADNKFKEYCFDKKMNDLM